MPGEAGFRTQLTVATLCRVVLNTGRRFPYPFAPVLARGFGLSLPAVTAMIAASQGMTLAAPLFGPLGDRWGYRRLMLLGMGTLALGMLLPGMAAVPAALAGGLALGGLAKGIFDPAVQAHIGAQVPLQRRGRAIGCAEMAWAGSALLGIPCAGLLIAGLGWRAVFLALAALGATGLWALARVLPAPPPNSTAGAGANGLGSGWGTLLRSPQARAALAAGFLLSAANDCVFVVYGAWLEGGFGLGAAALGAATAAIGAAELLGEGLTAAFSDRLGLLRASLVGVVLTALGYAGLPLAGSELTVALAALFVAFLCFEFSIVTTFSLCTEILPGARGTMMSAYLAALGLGRMTGALLGGTLWSLQGLPAVVTCAAVATLGGGWLLRGASRGKEPHHGTRREPPRLPEGRPCP